LKQRSAFDALFLLWRGGMHFGGVVDCGCADGHFGLMLAEHGPARASTVLSIDAQQQYGDSLQEISRTMGWHHRICALGQKDGGTLRLLSGGHAYWASPRPKGDPYWTSLPGVRTGEAIEVPQRTIDSLVTETLLPGPYLVKLDLQGGEADALRGAKRTLRNTEVVLIEVQLEDFRAIHEVLDASGFLLFDLSDLNYSPAGSLAWFYATYVAERRRELLRVPLWAPEAGAQIIAKQDERRNDMRRYVAESLQRYRTGGWPPLAG
jgi:FkbM family methyltransferase